MFKEGQNYNVTNNGLIATKISENKWDCVVFGDKEIPKNRISKWKIKINKNKTNKTNIDIAIGISPISFKGDKYNEYWSIISVAEKTLLYIKDKSQNYNNYKGTMKEGDIYEVIVDRKLGNLSYSINNINYGIACSEIPKDDILFPTVVLFERRIEVELLFT